MNLVSVIIPTYNRAALLKEAVHSVYAQSYRPIECIIVDDGSTDRTKAVIEELSLLQEPGFRIRYFVQQRAGAQAARNRGTNAATGEFIQYLDSDDLLFPDKLKIQVEYLLKHPVFDGVFGDWRIGLPQKSELVIGYASDNMIEQFLGERCIHTLSFLMRRDIVKRIGEWDVQLKRNQEIDFHIRGLLVGARFDYQPLCTGLWRQHNEERIATSTNLFDIICFYNKMEQLLLTNGLFSATVREKIVMHYSWFLSAFLNCSDKELVAVMKEAVRLNPGVAFYQSRKLRLLQAIAGRNLAFGIWLKRFRSTSKRLEEC